MINKKYFIVTLNLFLLFILSSVTCTKVVEKKMILQTNCDDVEVVHDLLYSASQLEKYFEVENVDLVQNNESTDCGYLLINGRDSLMIPIVITDVELFDSCRSFYKFKVDKY